eukprot:TRINITY_DN101250_c0_g1_i1.p1 TRINITY_DN101250_c0_g1~~TRINITY_DN101250_c0_g1_i1.p1  ORF type:complete len:1043 (+),score=101.00 TRINITY_DN101250_c0_g1_i1:115-3243(+)
MAHLRTTSGLNLVVFILLALAFVSDASLRQHNNARASRGAARTKAFSGYQSCRCIEALPPGVFPFVVGGSPETRHGVGQCKAWDDWEEMCTTKTPYRCDSRRPCAQGSVCRNGTCECEPGTCVQADTGQCKSFAVSHACTPGEENKPREEREAYCFQPWCYVDIRECSGVWATQSTLLLHDYIGFSYQTCGGHDLWDMDVHLIVQNPLDARGMPDPYWQGMHQALRETFVGSVRSTHLPRDPVEEADAVTKVWNVQSEKNRLRNTVVVAALVDTVLCRESRVEEHRERCKEQNTGNAYANFLGSSGSVIFLEVGPSTPNQYFRREPYVLTPDNWRGGYDLGEQYCKSWHPSHSSIAFFMGPEDAERCNDRVRGFKDALRKAEGCQDITNYTFAETRANWSYDQAVAATDSLLTYRPLTNVIFACNSLMAMGAADTARARGLYDLLVIGYDNYPRMASRIKEKEIFMTVDQQVSYPYPRWGLPHISLLVASQAFYETSGGVRMKGLTNLAAYGCTGKGCIVKTPVSLVVRDMQSLIRSQILEEDVSEAPDRTIIQGTIDIARLVSFDIEQQTFTTVLDLMLEWQDLRLTWNCPVYNSDVTVSADRLWIPPDAFQPLMNPTEDQEVVKVAVSVNCTGNVVMRKRSRMTFGCEFDVHLNNFPFDQHECQTTWKVPHHKMFVVGQHPRAESIIGWQFGVEGKNLIGADPGAQGIVYTFRFTRFIIKFYVAFFLPCALINVISFQQFWIDPAQTIDRAGLAGTALLAAIMLRETAQFPEGMGSYAVYYWLVSIIFHFAALSCTVFGRGMAQKGSAYDLGHVIEKHTSGVGTRSALDLGRLASGSSSSSAEEEQRYHMALRIVSLLGYYRQSSLDLLGKRVIFPLFMLFFTLTNTLFLVSEHQEEFKGVVVLSSVVGTSFIIYWISLVVVVLWSSPTEYIALTVGMQPAQGSFGSRLMSFFLPGKFHDKIQRQHILMRQNSYDLESHNTSRTLGNCYGNSQSTTWPDDDYDFNLDGVQAPDRLCANRAMSNGTVSNGTTSCLTLERSL